MHTGPINSKKPYFQDCEFVIRWEGYGENCKPTLESWKNVKDLSAVKKYVADYVKSKFFSNILNSNILRS